jgi:hypothetical protein
VSAGTEGDEQAGREQPVVIEAIEELPLAPESNQPGWTPGSNEVSCTFTIKAPAMAPDDMLRLFRELESVAAKYEAERLVTTILKQ